MKSTTTLILWIVYICLLLVLLPHTAWAFKSMEPEGGVFTAWLAALVFEAAIAALTHKLAKHIEQTAKIRGRLHRFIERYLSPYSIGLFVATAVSMLANLAHAVEFGKPLLIFATWGIPQGLYSVAFGGVLPLASLIFARVLSNVTDSEDAPNPELEGAKQTITGLRRQVHETELKLKDAEQRVRIAEERFGAAGDLMRRIFSEDKRERILAVREWKPKLSGAAIALIADSSPAYVSEVLSEVEVQSV